MIIKIIKIIKVFTIFKNERFFRKMWVVSKHVYVVVVSSLFLESLETLKRHTNSFKKQISGVSSSYCPF